MHSIAIFFMAAVGIGGVLWVFVYPILSGERKAEKRLASVTKAASAERTTRGNQTARRDSIETTLKEYEERHKKGIRKPLSVRIALAGLSWSKRQFIMISVGIGIVMFMVGLLSGSIFIAGAMGFVGALGLPRWALSYLQKRREKAFLNVFPDAIDIIVRGVKAGLPLIDCLKMISAESPEPVRSEFRTTVETQSVGVPLGEACARLYEEMPVPEANFFGIVIMIQQKSGGNLSEALGNLSKVLRERKKMKAKVRAVSQEAKASAAIIGSLPIAVMVVVYVTTPEYISLLWTEPTGRVMLALAAFWMTMGIMVMRKMINFDF